MVRPIDNSGSTPKKADLTRPVLEGAEEATAIAKEVITRTSNAINSAETAASHLHLTAKTTFSGKKRHFKVLSEAPEKIARAVTKTLNKAYGHMMHRIRIHG